jgi:hypothetical protein
VHPGGIQTSIARNMTFHVDDHGGTDKDAFAGEFERFARTSPAKAAAVILGGVAKGRERILIGADARAADRLVRLVPVRYYDVMRRLEPLLRR